LSNEKDVESFNDALKDAVPSIGKPESLEVTLQRGVVDPTTGLWQTVAEVRELTGEDEEFLASLETDRNMTYAKYMNSLIARSTHRIGTVLVNNNQATIQELITGDRDALFLGVIKATYGPEKTFSRICPECEKPNDITINLTEDFPVVKSTVDLHAPLEVTLRKGNKVKVRIPTGADTLYIAKASNTSAEQSTFMIARCTVWDEGEAPADPVTWAKALSLADRNIIVKTLTNIEVGPKMQGVNTQCAHCGTDMEVAVDWVSLLLG
jgi:hypothetical protein